MPIAMYYAKITSCWTATNRLKKYLAEQVKLLENKDVTTAQEAFDYLNAHVALGNRRYNKCTPEKLTMRKAAMKEDIYLECSVFQVALYPKAGLFVAPTLTMPVSALQMDSPALLSLF